MDLLRPAKAFDALQRRHPAAAVPVAVVKKFGDDNGGNLAAVIAYYGFFSLFPLLMVFVTGLGFVLAGNPDAQEAVLHSTLRQIPIVGEQIRTGSLEGNGVALAIGLVVALLAGISVTLATQTAFDRIYEVPRRERRSFVSSRLHGLAMLAILGTLQIVSTAATGLIAGGLGGLLLAIAGLTVSLAANVALFIAAFRLLTDDSVPTSELWPGVFAATILWTIVQAVGGVYIAHVVKGAGTTYGTFATVIGLLTWLFLGARIVVYAAELNAVLAKRLWPRALFEPREPADDRAPTAFAKIQEQTD